jgi:hypothetical protein
MISLKELKNKLLIQGKFSQLSNPITNLNKKGSNKLKI